MRFNGTAILLACGAILMGAGAIALFGRPSVVQPIAFNHSLHVQDMGLVCTVCHLYAETGPRATIPNIQVCGMCHASPLTDSPDEALLVEHIQNQEPVPWQRIYWVEDHVFFSHRRHTSVAGIACETCHGAVGELSEPLSRQLVRIRMSDCVACHRLEGASTDCIVCHR